MFIRDFSTFPLILSTSKYFRYVFQLSVSFYQLPIIPDIFACDKIKDPPFTFFPLIYCNIQKWQTENFWQIKRDELNSANIWSMRLEPKIENRYLLFQKSDFTMKGASVKVVILSFSSQLAMKPLHTKNQLWLSPPSCFS